MGISNTPLERILKERNALREQLLKVKKNANKIKIGVHGVSGAGKSTLFVIWSLFTTTRNFRKLAADPSVSYRLTISTYGRTARYLNRVSEVFCKTGKTPANAAVSPEKLVFDLLYEQKSDSGKMEKKKYRIETMDFAGVFFVSRRGPAIV